LAGLIKSGNGEATKSRQYKGFIAQQSGLQRPEVVPTGGIAAVCAALWQRSRSRKLKRELLRRGCEFFSRRRASFTKCARRHTACDNDIGNFSSRDRFPFFMRLHVR
jgi:hypothetical protein